LATPEKVWSIWALRKDMVRRIEDMAHAKSLTVDETMREPHPCPESAVHV
jgi:hypothetical protein